jgi:hypothetical protein
MCTAASAREVVRKLSSGWTKNRPAIARRWSDVGHSPLDRTSECTAEVGVIGGGMALERTEIEH